MEQISSLASNMGDKQENCLELTVAQDNKKCNIHLDLHSFEITKVFFHLLPHEKELSLLWIRGHFYCSPQIHIP